MKDKHRNTKGKPSDIFLPLLKAQKNVAQISFGPVLLASQFISTRKTSQGSWEWHW